jgi:hypothetical protein
LEAGKVGFKMYPNVTSIHAALDAFRSVLIEERLAATEIGEIHVGCGYMTLSTWHGSIDPPAGPLLFSRPRPGALIRLG